MKKLSFLILIGLLLFNSACKEDVPTFLNDWDEDVYYFSKNLKEEHANLFFQLSEQEFDKDVKKLRDSSGEFSDAEMVIGLSKIISKIGDSHTATQLGNHLTFLPFRVEYFADGIFIIESDITQEEILGKKITGLNGISINTVLDSFRKVIAYENEASFKKQVTLFLRAKEFYSHFNFMTAEDGFVINTENEIDYTINTTATGSTVLENNSPLFLKNKDRLYWKEELLEEDLMYVQYNKCKDGTNPNFDDFTDEITNSIDNNTGIKKIVLDLRHNSGGNSGIARPLIKKMKRFVSQDRLKSENIYVIIGRKTFSSAILNAIEIQVDINPVLIGEPTSGKPNHYGEVRSFRLPNSNIQVWYSTKYFEHTDNDESSLNPDVIVEYSFQDYINGVDPIMDIIISE